MGYRDGDLVGAGLDVKLLGRLVIPSLRFRVEGLSNFWVLGLARVLRFGPRNLFSFGDFGF